MNNNKYLLKINSIYDFLFSHLDKVIFICILLLSAIGIIVIYSSSGKNLNLVFNKSIHLLIGITIFLIISKIKPKFISNFALSSYIILIILLIVVLLIGSTKKGSTRWLNLIIFEFQPSELMKIFLPMVIAWYFQKNELKNNKWSQYAISFILIIIPVALIIKQPDLGTALLILISGLFVVYFAQISFKFIILSILAFMFSFPLIWKYFLHDYQKNRILTLINPTIDPLGIGYHINQSLTAIGSGGIWGMGWMKGTQTHLKYIPEQNTDFIFAVIAEEFGFIGVIILLTLFITITFKSLLISANSINIYNRTLSASFALTFFCYAFINIAMVCGLLPVVGVPLPLISYGGTSTITLLIMLGIIMGIKNETISKFKK